MISYIKSKNNIKLETQCSIVKSCATKYLTESTCFRSKIEGIIVMLKIFVSNPYFYDKMIDTDGWGTISKYFR